MFGPIAVRRNVTELGAVEHRYARCRARGDELRGRKIGDDALDPDGEQLDALHPLEAAIQFGSHCAVTVAIAARIAPISAVATIASTSVNPAMRLQRRVMGPLPAQADGVELQHRPGGRLHPHHHGLRIQIDLSGSTKSA